jgi:membrane associated rhomboid family serine protease
MLGLKPDRGVIGMLVTLVVVSLIYFLGGAAVQQFYVEHLVMRPRAAIGWEPWQLVTSSFLDIGLRQILFTAITLLFFGNFVERQLGAAGFWKVFVVGGAAGALFAALLGRVLSPDAALAGSSAATTALLTAYAAVMDRQRVNAYGMGMVRGSLIAWIWIGISFLMIIPDLFSPAWREVLLQIAALVGGGLAGWIVVRRGFNLRGSLDRVRMWRLKRRYRVLTGGRESQEKGRWLN